MRGTYTVPPACNRRKVLRNTRKTGRVRATAAESFCTSWWRGTAPFALLRSLARGRMELGIRRNFGQQSQGMRATVKGGTGP
jgi:hypothetical protein